MLFIPKTPKGEEVFYDKGVIDFDDFKDIFYIDPEVL